VIDFVTLGPGVLWVAFIFSGVLAIGRSFQIEREQDRIQGILLSPIDRSAFYLGKVAATVLFMTVVETLIVPVAVLMFNFHFSGRIALAILALLLSTVGFAAVGTLFAAGLPGLSDPESVARAAPDAARLSDRRDDRVGAYSRGMQQRLAIARSLLHGPEMILLDEPFTGLDRDSSAGLEERLRRLRAEGRTCVMATHDLGQGLRAADRVLVLRGGRLALDSPARGLDPARLEALLAGTETAAAPGSA